MPVSISMIVMSSQLVVTVGRPSKYIGLAALYLPGIATESLPERFPLSYCACT